MLVIKKIGEMYYASFPKAAIYLNGNRFEMAGKVQFQEEPKTVQKRLKGSRVIHYLHRGMGFKMTIKDHTLEASKLRSKGDYQNDYFYFDSLEDEYEYKRFLQNWEAVKESYEEFEDIPFIVQDITGKTDNPYIVPFRLIGAEPVRDEELLYQYLPNVMKMAKEIGTKYGFEQIHDKAWDIGDKPKGNKWSVPDHSRASLRFLKINNNYEGDIQGNWASGISAGTWDECITRHNTHYHRIDLIFQQARWKIDQAGQPVDKIRVVSELTGIQLKVRQMKVKVSSPVNVAQVTKHIENLIESIKQ